MADNNFQSAIDALFDGMNNVFSTKTVVGEAVHIGETILLPLVDVSFGVGAGVFQAEKKNNGGGGLGGRITPSAVLVIQNGNIRLVNIKNQDTMTKILDMMPDAVEKVSSFVNKDKKEDEIRTEEDIEELLKEQ